MRFFLFSLLITLFVPAFAQACRCMQPNQTQATNTYNNANIVITGKVNSFAKSWGGHSPTATIQVERVFKGPESLIESNPIVIQYNPNSAACGSVLEAGQSYTLGLYDIRLPGNVSPGIGDYRAMDSCAQMNIQYYIKTKKEEK